MTNSDFARHIQIGERKRQNTDFTATEKDIADTLQDLTAEQLNKVAIYITGLRSAAWSVPGPPRIDIPAKTGPSEPCATWTTDVSPVAFDGTAKNPMPIKEKE